MATVLVLGPIFEADLEPEQYGYRPGRSALDAVRQVERLVRSGHTQDLRISLGCLGALGNSDSPLLSSPAGRVSDGFCTIDHQEISTSSGTSTP